MELSQGVITAAYIIAALLFIFSLAGLSKQETAQEGNNFGIAGMAIALLATILDPRVDNTLVIIGAMAVGAVIGFRLAQKVEMTEMPELVAILHSFVGLAAVFVGYNSYFDVDPFAHGYALVSSAEKNIHLVEVFLGVFIGAVTFTGSVIAFAKLRGLVNSAALMLPHRHKMNLVAGVISFALMIVFVQKGGDNFSLYLMTAIALVFGWHLVASIGGADMPVVVSMLNSYSGWAAAAAGFMLSNDLLIVTGALVGSSGAILSYIMCKAMNRSIINVLFGGAMGGAAVASADKGEQVQRNYRSGSADDAGFLMSNADSVVIVPGYGMAQGRAQNAVKELCELLKEQGVRVRFAIHPVAGRMPGHMNVLLAEADVAYEDILEMDEINSDFPATDVVLVIGANDVVNPAAKDDPSSPIYGMPILEAHKARTIMVIKRSMATGYAGLDNDLFYNEKTMMIFGDAKKVVEDMTKAINGTGH